jgi:hypothetical protein
LHVAEQHQLQQRSIGNLEHAAAPNSENFAGRLVAWTEADAFKKSNWYVDQQVRHRSVVATPRGDVANAAKHLCVRMSVVVRGCDDPAATAAVDPERFDHRARLTTRVAGNQLGHGRTTKRDHGRVAGD